MGERSGRSGLGPAAWFHTLSKFIYCGRRPWTKGEKKDRPRKNYHLLLLLLLLSLRVQEPRRKERGEGEVTTCRVTKLAHVSLHKFAARCSKIRANLVTLATRFFPCHAIVHQSHDRFTYVCMYAPSLPPLLTPPSQAAPYQ